MADKSRKWLTAADCAARTGLTVRALRVYEREGLLEPSRAANGWRRYGPDDLMRLNTISVLKALGLTLAQIRGLLRDAAPSLLSVLQVQAKSWRERQSEAAKTLELAEAAIHRLERNQQLSLEELCELVNALQERSTPMQQRATLIADLMKELLSPDEQWQWQAWWASHSVDLNQNTSYLRERLQSLDAMQDLLQQGLSPGDPAVQEQVLKQLALLNRYGVRERTMRGFGGLSVAVTIVVEAMLFASIGAAIDWLWINDYPIEAAYGVFRLFVTAHLLLVALAWALVTAFVGAIVPAAQEARLEVVDALARA